MFSQLVACFVFFSPRRGKDAQSVDGSTWAWHGGSAYVARQQRTDARSCTETTFADRFRSLFLLHLMIDVGIANTLQHLHNKIPLLSQM